MLLYVFQNPPKVKEGEKKDNNINKINQNNIILAREDQGTAAGPASQRSSKSQRHGALESVDG